MLCVFRVKPSSSRCLTPLGSISLKSVSMRSIGGGIVEAHRRGRHVVVFDVGDRLGRRRTGRGELRQHDRVDAHLARQRGDARRWRRRHRLGRNRADHSHARPKRGRMPFTMLLLTMADMPRPPVRATAPSGSAMRCDGVARSYRRLSGKPSAEQSRRIEIAQHQIGIRRRVGSTPPGHSRRVGIGARRLRTDLQEAQ